MNFEIAHIFLLLGKLVVTGRETADILIELAYIANCIAVLLVNEYVR